MKENTPHINKAVRTHYGALGDDFECAPISSVDVRIVKSLVDVLHKIGAESVSGLMNNFKLEPDLEILTNLEDLLDNMQVDVNEDGTKLIKKKVPYWIHFDDMDSNRIIRMKIFSYKKVECVGENEDMYGIMLNETPDDVKGIPLFANHILIYYNEKERDVDFEKLNILK